MTLSTDFFESVVNSVTDHIAVIDERGEIVFVNTAWVEFGIDNANPRVRREQWIGVNYLRICESAGLAGDTHGAAVAKGTRRIIDCEQGFFSHEYPCHSDTEQRWYVMQVTPMEWSGPPRYVIVHQNVTQRKLAERQVHALSLSDGLTGLPNRRNFDEFLASEWRRGQRDQTPVSLLLLDVDHFKLFNDRYGHAAGDECLKKVAGAVRATGRRPADLPARYGGEEFTLVMGATGADAAFAVACELVERVAALDIPHSASPTAPVVTASIGVATLVPDAQMASSALFQAADQALYEAKNGGRNRVMTSSVLTWTPPLPYRDANEPS